MILLENGRCQSFLDTRSEKIRLAGLGSHLLLAGVIDPHICLEKFLTVWRTAAPGCPRRRRESLRHRSFHALWVGHRPMSDCPDKFNVGCALRTRLYAISTRYHIGRPVAAVFPSGSAGFQPVANQAAVGRESEAHPAFSFQGGLWPPSCGAPVQLQGAQCAPYMTGGTPVPPGKELLVGTSLGITKASPRFSVRIWRLGTCENFLIGTIFASVIVRLSGISARRTCRSNQCGCHA
jgi:hypothetical protein